MTRHPDVGREIAEHADAALTVGLLFWILRGRQHAEITRADDGQRPPTLLDLERIRGAAAGVPGRNVCGERDRPDTNRVTVLEPAIDARWRVAEDTHPDENPHWQECVGIVAARGKRI